MAIWLMGGVADKKALATFLRDTVADETDSEG